MSSEVSPDKVMQVESSTSPYYKKLKLYYSGKIKEAEELVENDEGMTAIF